MLLQFSVANFLSFDQEAVFSMLAATGNEHARHLVQDSPTKGQSILRAAALYGANGAGKSSLVSAMKFAQELIVKGTRGGQSILVMPFKLGSETAHPSKFEFTFQTMGTVYNYGFRADARRVVEEWLFEERKSGERPLFQRTTSEDGTVEVEFGSSFAGKTSKNKQFLEFVAPGTRRNQLFLTEASERNVPAVRDIVRWFDDALVVIPAEVRVKGLEVGLHMFPSRFAFAAEFLKTAGTGIDHINTTEEPFEIDGFNPPLKEDDRQAILQGIAELDSESDIMEAIDPSGRRLLLMKGADGRPVRISMALEHRASNGNLVSFDIAEESDGTQRLINLLPALLMLKGAPEKVVVLDELDRRFHTLLSRRLLQFALNCDDEHFRSQLIFTTHDTNLLDLDLLRRDEIWFVEKDTGGASHLSSLAEYKVRPDLKIEKGYLNGRFGAIPFSGEPQLLGWLSPDDPAPDESVTKPGSVGQ